MNGVSVQGGGGGGLLKLDLKLGVPEAVDSANAVERSLTVGTCYQTEVCGMQLYESANDVVVQSRTFTLVLSSSLSRQWGILRRKAKVLVSAGPRTSTMGEMKHSSSGINDSKVDRSVLTSIR